MGLPGRRDNEIDHGSELGMWRVFGYEIADPLTAGQDGKGLGQGLGKAITTAPFLVLSSRPMAMGEIPGHLPELLPAREVSWGGFPLSSAVSTSVGYLGERPPQMPFWDPGVDFGTEP